MDCHDGSKALPFGDLNANEGAAEPCVILENGDGALG
jgi:hypothetical protein